MAIFESFSTTPQFHSSSSGLLPLVSIYLYIHKYMCVCALDDSVGRVIYPFGRGSRLKMERRSSYSFFSTVTTRWSVCSPEWSFSSAVRILRHKTKLRAREGKRIKDKRGENKISASSILFLSLRTHIYLYFHIQSSKLSEERYKGDWLVAKTTHNVCCPRRSTVELISSLMGLGI